MRAEDMVHTEPTQRRETSVIYEVNLAIDPVIAEDFARWLVPHIEEILALPGFETARCYTRDSPYEDDIEAPARVRWTVHYHLSHQAALDDYLREHATRLRGDGLRHFEGRFEATRRVLHTVSFTEALHQSLDRPPDSP